MKKHLLIALFVMGALVLLTPRATKAAFNVDLSSAAPSDVIDITSQIPAKTPEGIEATMKAYQYGSPVGSEYTLEFDISEPDGSTVTHSPFLVSAGVKIKSLNYDSATQKLTLVVRTEKFYPPEMKEPQPVMVFVFVKTTESTTPGQGGPPLAMAGGYVATTVLDWQIIPPKPGEASFGISLSGDEGTSGFFNMFLPPTMLAFMSQMTGKNVTVEDLAIFVDNDQASTEVNELNGGAFIDINVTFTSGVTSTGAAGASGGSVTKKIMTKEKLPLSLAAKKEKMRKGKKVLLYGWLKSEKKNKKITIYGKKKGEKKYEKVAEVLTRKNGFYYYKFAPAETGTYFYKAVYKKKTSPKEKLKVAA